MTHEGINAMLEHVSALAGYFPNGVLRSDFWTGMIHSAYSTGLRRGDLLRVKRSQIAANGTANIMQNKTGYGVTVKFSQPAMEAIGRMAHAGPLALPWSYHENALSRQFRKLAATAEVRCQFRWLRRSAGSYADREQRGNGRRLLGHRSERIFHDYYEDQTITGGEPVAPPEL